MPCHGLPNQTLAGTLAGLPSKLTTTGRASIKLVAEHGQQEFTVADEVGFVGYVGFHGVGRQNCRGRVHHRRPHAAALRAASSFTHQGADFFVGLAGDARRVQRRDFMRGPANASRPQAHLLGPQALGDAKVDRGSGIARFRLDGRKPKDGLRHVCTPLGVVEHAANYGVAGAYPASCLVKRASVLGFELLRASPFRTATKS